MVKILTCSDVLYFLVEGVIIIRSKGNRAGRARSTYGLMWKIEGDYILAFLITEFPGSTTCIQYLISYFMTISPLPYDWAKKKKKFEKI